MQTTQPPFRIAGYLPDYRLERFTLGQAQHLTDLILFSAEPNANGSLNLDRLKNAPWPAPQKWKKENGTRLHLSIGGWERSAHFASVSSSPTKIDAFVKDALRVCKERQIDGIDIDWEHPKDEQEQKGYAALLTALRKAMDPLGLKLSMTLAAWQPVSKDAFAAVHWIQVMAYDHAGKHSTLVNSQSDMKKLLAAGAPAEKLLLGLPLYGRDVKNASRTMTYSEIVKQYSPKPSDDEVQGIYFNGPSTISAKVRYTKEQKFAGVFFWEIGQDAAGDASLIRLAK